jgi:hypothetical protein
MDEAGGSFQDRLQQDLKIQGSRAQLLTVSELGPARPDVSVAAAGTEAAGSVQWEVRMPTSRLVVHMVVEYSPKPDGVGSDLHLCGVCGVGLVHHPHGEALGSSLIQCPNCHTLNQP